MVMMIYFDFIARSDECTSLVVPDMNSRMTCRKKNTAFRDFSQLQGFPIDSHAFARVRHRIMEIFISTNKEKRLAKVIVWSLSI